MPNHRATSKSLRQNAKRQVQNVHEKSRIRTLVKKVKASVKVKNVEEAQTGMRVAISAIDTAAKKRVIHPNNAARHKSNLMREVEALSKV
ncbi:MAG: 30S ribosomal protein S20 [Candidatus Hinthialibacter antarcticus]|nr:30S ribosomal protein S20 [Candidatus Hinthialibacter antarcticus]